MVGRPFIHANDVSKYGSVFMSSSALVLLKLGVLRLIFLYLLNHEAVYLIKLLT